jgi:hypothetical protein
MAESTGNYFFLENLCLLVTFLLDVRVRRKLDPRSFYSWQSTLCRELLNKKKTLTNFIRKVFTYKAIRRNLILIVLCLQFLKSLLIFAQGKEHFQTHNKI